MLNDSQELSVIFVPLVRPDQTPTVEVFCLLQNDIQLRRVHVRRINTPRCSLFQEAPSEMRPRLCVIERGSNGYGFNLHSERARPGQYVRAVDADSPAERAGLQPRDRILQVPQ